MYLFLWNGCRLLPQVRRRDFLQTPLLHLNHRWSQTTSLFRYKRHANLCFRFPDDVSFDALLVFSSFLKQCPTAIMNDWLNPNSWNNTFFLPIHLERKDTNNVTTDEIGRSSQLRTLLKRVVVNRTWKKFKCNNSFAQIWFKDLFWFRSSCSFVLFLFYTLN